MVYQLLNFLNIHKWLFWGADLAFQQTVYIQYVTDRYGFSARLSERPEVHFCLINIMISAGLSPSNDVDRVSPAGEWVGLVAPKTFNL